MIIWVAVWFVLVICVTILNKTFFKQLKCPFPVSITLIHMVSCCVYSTFVKRNIPSFFNGRKLEKEEYKTLFFVSILFVLNLVLSNSSLKYNSLALDQMFRCTIPAITAILEYLLARKVHPFRVYLSLIPVIVGTMLVCLGDINYTYFGLVLLLCSGIVSSLKGIITKRLLSSGNPISPLQLLQINAGFGMLELFPLAFYQERSFFTEWLPNTTVSVACVLILHGFLAFFLNIANFQAVKAGSPLMMNVVGNTKQVVMVVLSVYLFNQKMKPIGIVGSIINIMGSAWYSYVENTHKTPELKAKDSEQNLVEKV